MGFGTSIMKSLMFIFNGIVWVLGLVLFIVGIVVLVEGQNWNDIIDNKTVPVSALLIVVGLVIAVVGFLGCFGAMKQNSSMLLIYAIILGVIIIIQLVAGILAFIFSDEAEEILQEGLSKGLDEYGKDDSIIDDSQDSVWTTGIDWVQENLECCGIGGAEDWAQSNGIATWWVAVDGGNHTFDTPSSCCSGESPSATCGDGAATDTNTDVYSMGCLDEGKAWILKRGRICGITGVGFVFFEIICVVFALVVRKHS